jgi:ribosomal protein L23
MKLFNIIKKPITTEKTAGLELNSTYVLEVDETSTKIDIKKSILEVY